MSSKPQISVIISTYNSEKWLEKVLLGYACQDLNNFELVLADDGSKKPTFDLIEQMRDQLPYEIKHIWQEDEGFQKSKILNKAILACDSDYILMSDGDCIPRQDFVSQHLAYREKGYFLSGGYFMLPLTISELITKEDIFKQHCFDVAWLKARGLKASFKNTKLRANNKLNAILNFITPTNASWNGHNASGWKADILAVNGFDERMQYGGQDRELGERLFNYGIKSKQIRYSAICVHLDHPRGYKTPESINKNLAIRATTKNKKSKWTAFGIQKNTN